MAPGVSRWMRESFRGSYRLVGWSIWLADRLPRGAKRRLGAAVIRYVPKDALPPASGSDY